MTRWQWIVSRIVRRVWFRAALISLCGVLVAALAGVVARFVPFRVAGNLGQNAVDSILEIMASSMLAVTTFSINAMVTAYSSSTQTATPRATQLMVDDPTSQNALSTFLGAFVFSVVGIIGLQTGIYGEQGRVILFAGTVLLVGVVVVTLLRWIAHITIFGRLADVIDRVEHAAAEAMRRFAEDARIGGLPAVAIPTQAERVCGNTTGYVTHVDLSLLGRLADSHGLTLHVVATPGVMVDPLRPLLHAMAEDNATRPNLDDELRGRLVSAFSIERHRSFDQDPRLGLIALGEIASRALSPAVNDPGTAIEVMNALLRVLLLLPAEEPDQDERAQRPAVHITRPVIGEMMEDAFRPLLRDGASMIEVMLRASGTLDAIHRNLPVARPAAIAYAARLRSSAVSAIESPASRDEFEAAHDRLWAGRG